MVCPLTKNKGILLSTTEYVAIMDADDVSYPDRLETQLKRMEKDEVDFLAGYVEVIDEEDTVLYRMDNLPVKHEDVVKKMRVNNCMPHPAWMLKKRSYLALDGYADIQGCEDYDLLLRAMNAGYKLGNCDRIILKYRLSQQSISRDNLYRQYLMMRYIQDKYFYHKLPYNSYQEYENRKYTPEKAKRYAKAADAFQRALICKKRKQFAGVLINTAEIFISREYIEKIVRYLSQTII